MRRNARIEDIKRQSTATLDSWNTETNTSATSVTPSTTSTILTSTSQQRATIPIAHRLVPVKGPYIGFKKCCECRKYLIYYTMKKEDIYVCQVCGVRVHGGCVDRITNNCVMTSQYVGGLLQNAIIRKNKTKWDPTCQTTTVCSTPSSPQSPTSLMNVNSSSKYDLDEDDDEERMMTWEDVTIKQKDVIVKGRMGEGRFGTVHFGVYHGDAAIKFVNMDYVEESRRQEEFRSEVVAAYKNSRHNHIALFLGYFADPITNQFAIITNYYHGDTLYNRIHESNEEIEISWIFNISLQICQAMSYLHKKKILHKDLRSKNIMIDKSNKAFVADFGLLRMERLVVPKRTYSLMIPNHWVDYIPPEIARQLIVQNNVFLPNGLSFSTHSDIFSFGTIFYELLTRRMPTLNEPWEKKIYDKLCGTKASLNRRDSTSSSSFLCSSNLALRVDVRVSQLLMSCWSYESSNRPSFQSLGKSITTLMKRRDSSNRNSIRCFESTF